MGAKKILHKAFFEVLTKVNTEKNLNLNPLVLEYIADVLSTYYKKVPLYLIDVKASSPFRLYKLRGDVSLLLVGFFNEWVNRLNRPISERDYIISGKLNYEYAYIYLDTNFGRFLKEETQKDYIKFIKEEETLFTQLDVFKEMSLLFEDYANLLKLMKKHNENLKDFFSTFDQLRLAELEDLIFE